MTPLLRARDVAKTLLISEPTVYELARTGKLTATIFQAWGGKRSTIRFTQEAVRKFIEEHTKGAEQ